RRLATDWIKYFKHPLLLLETFVDPRHFQGTLYKAANWQLLGSTRGFSRISGGAYEPNASPKMVFAYPLQRNARRLLSQSKLKPEYQFGETTLMITAAQMKTLPELFNEIEDPRRAEGQRHRLSTILGIATGAVLCGRVGYKGIAQWAQSLGQDARARFRCSYKNERYIVPSEYVIRQILIRVAPDALDRALKQWSALYAVEDESLAIDGKTMCNALNGEGKQAHIMSAIGHQSMSCHAQKKSANFS
ncbi:transposase family protein, partial [Moraxella sp.]|uniref:transposase family protein n=1 Tax=Moraxella sp. TaxID=479 RepID=UPI0026353F89